MIQGPSDEHVWDMGGQRMAEALRTAEGAYALLGRRDRVLGTQICADPAWNMLLDLFIASGRRRLLSVSALCIGSRASPATAHRYMSLLVEAGLVRREADPSDGRRHHVLLSAEGRRRMFELLAAPELVRPWI